MTPIKAWTGLVLGATAYAAIADTVLYFRGQPMLSTAFRSASRGPVSGPALAAAWFGGFAALTAHFYWGSISEKRAIK